MSYKAGIFCPNPSITKSIVPISVDAKISGLPLSTSVVIDVDVAGPIENLASFGKKITRPWSSFFPVYNFCVITCYRIEFV